MYYWSVLDKRIKIPVTYKSCLCMRMKEKCDRLSSPFLKLRYSIKSVVSTFE